MEDGWEREGEGLGVFLYHRLSGMKKDACVPRDVKCV